MRTIADRANTNVSKQRNGFEILRKRDGEGMIGDETSTQIWKTLSQTANADNFCWPTTGSLTNVSSSVQTRRAQILRGSDAFATVVPNSATRSTSLASHQHLRCHRKALVKSAKESVPRNKMCERERRQKRHERQACAKRAKASVPLPAAPH
jgi:hypothetical protein